MKYVKDNMVYETPIYMEVGGARIELTDEQLLQLGYVQDYVVTGEQSTYITTATQTYVNKMDILLSTISVSTPEGSHMDGDMIYDLPFKLGYKWEPQFDGSVISYVSVPDPDAIGTSDKPFIFIEGSSNALLPNAFYVYNGVTYVYVGLSKSNAISWSDCESDMEAL